jgi:hypothetical protein
VQRKDFLSAVCRRWQSAEGAESFVKSSRRSSNEENWTILKKHLRMKRYIFQLVKAIWPNHKATRFIICCHIFNALVLGKLVYRLLSSC